MVTLEQLKEKILKNPYAMQIAEAVAIQEKLQYYTIPFTDYQYAPSYHKEYLIKMKKKINNTRAYNTFFENITYPLPTAEFTKTIFNSLSKVFYGDGKIIEYNPLGKYDTVGFDYAKNTLWNRYINAPNSLIITNKDEDGNTYRNFIDIGSVKYIELEHNIIEELIYKVGDKMIYVDDEVIVAFDENQIYTEVQEHGFNICPVAFLSNKKIDYRKPIIRVNELVTSLGDFEELLTVSICSNIINRYILPSIVEAKRTGKQAGCNYKTSDTYCENGYLYTKAKKSGSEVYESYTVFNGDSPAKCPVCNKETGYGSIFEVSTTNMSADDFSKVIQNIFNYKEVSRESLEYPSIKRKELETNIYNKIVNKQDSLNNAQQHNEVRVSATMEDKTAVLLELKKVFEGVLSEVITQDLTIKNKNYKSTFVNLGNKFFLQSSAEYQELIKQAKENNIIDYVDYEKGLIEVQYVETPFQRNRNLFILELEKNIKPYRNLNHTLVCGLYQSGVIDKVDFELYVNFNKYVKELESAKVKDIIELYPNLSLKEQINKIKSDIYSLIKTNDGTN